jgi:alkaline phosphatase D
MNPPQTIEGYHCCESQQIESDRMSKGSNVDWSRRDFVRASLDAAAAIALGSLPAFGDERDVRFRANPFGLGVASGDPHTDGIVLWARLDPSALDQAGALRSPVPVRWELSEDERFRRIVRKGSQIAQPDLGHSVHAEIEGLRPGRQYWYRFMAGGEVSPTGRTKTAPADGGSLRRLQFAFASCQHYQQGYYTAYRRMAEEDLDLVVHLGDYIYEEPSTGPIRVRQIPAAGEVITLDEYRTRYSIYRSDPDLQAAHAAFPWVVTPDDHDVSDDYAGPFSDHGMPDDQFLVRRAAAYQAYYEFMPLRRSSLPVGPQMKIFRHVQFGDLVAFHVLDTRQYRTKQPCGAIGRPPRCSDAFSPGQHILGPNQERWLLHGLSASRSRWNIMANQVMITEMGLMRNDARTFSVDKWDGYLVERTKLLQFLAEAKPSNPVFITGDFHSNLVGDLKVDFDDPSSPTIGTEFVGTSISSGGDGSDSTQVGREALSQNPHLKFFNANRGYVRCTMTPSVLTSDFRTVPYVSRPDAPVETKASFVVENGKPGAQRA